MVLRLKIDEKGGALYLNGRRVLLRHAYIFQSMKKKMEEFVGSSAGFLFHRAGKESSMMLSEDVTYFGNAVKKLSYLGMGNYRLKKVDGTKWEIKANATPFSIGFSKRFGKSAYPFCHYIAGFLEGLGELSSGRSCRSVEVSCITRGDDVCKFVVELQDEESEMSERGSVGQKESESQELKNYEGVVKFDEKSGFYMLKGWPELIVPVEFYSILRLEGSRIIGKAISEIIYLSTSEWLKLVSPLVKIYIGVIKGIVPLRIKAKKLQEFFDHYYSKVWGFGRAKIVKCEKDEVIIRLYNSGFAAGYITRGVNTSTPVCDAMRGYLSGWGKLLLRKNCQVEETKCIALGDEFCEFVIRKT